MKSMCIAVLLIFLTQSAHAFDDCDLILSDHLSASIQNLAQLRYDLDSQMAKGDTNTITHSLLSAFARKKAEILTAGVPSGLTSEVLEQKIKDQIEKIQSKDVAAKSTHANTEEQQRTQLDENQLGIFEMPQLVEPRQNASLCKVSGHQILFASGNAAKSANKILNSVELYDVRTGKSEVIGHLKDVRTDLRLTLLPNGKVMAWGGKDPNGKRNLVELIDPVSKTITQPGLGLESENEYFLMPNRKILQIGEKGESSVADLDRLVTNSFMVDQIPFHANRVMSQQPDGSVIILGGTQLGVADPLRQILKIDGTTFEVTRLSDLETPITSHAQVSAENNQVIVSGGYRGRKNGKLFSSDRVEQIDLSTGKATLLGNLSTTRVHHTMVRLSETQVMIIGGFPTSSMTDERLRTVEIFHLDTGYSEIVGELKSPQIFSAIVTDEGVLVIERDWPILELVRFGRVTTQ